MKAGALGGMCVLWWGWVVPTPCTKGQDDFAGLENWLLQNMQVILPHPSSLLPLSLPLGAYCKTLGGVFPLRNTVLSSLSFI